MADELLIGNKLSFAYAESITHLSHMKNSLGFTKLMRLLLILSLMLSVMYF